MANPKKRLAENVLGDFFVDSTCIDCDTCRQIAPQVFAEGDGFAFVHRQPSGADRRDALQVESGILKLVNPEKSPLAVDFVHLDGPHKGSTVFAIGRVDSDTFRFCYRDRAEDRPTGFVTKAGDTRCGLVTFNHQKK